MTDNYINVTVTSKENKRVTVSTQDPGFEVTATTDTGKFWAQTAENWATSDTIVENKDYSSKYYANKAKVNAENARVYEASVKETYNSLIAESGSISDEIRTTGSEVIDNINATKTNILKDIEFVADGKKEEIQELAEKAKDDIESTGFYMRDDKLYFINSKGEEEEFKSGGGSGLVMFDTILKDHVLTYEESNGLALQGTYVYKEAIAGSRYGYADFYNKCLEEYENSTDVGLPWQQPILTSNGTMGGDIFAVEASYEYTNQPAWQAFDGSGGTAYGSNTNNTPFWVTFYEPKSLKVSNLKLLGRTDVATTNANIEIQACDDNETWETLTSLTQTITANTAIEIPVNSTNYYKYYRINFVSFSMPSTAYNCELREIVITATTKAIRQNPNGHLFYDIADKDKVDEIFASTGMAWMYGIDTENERIFLPRNNWFEQTTTDESEVGNFVEAGLPNITGRLSTLTFSNSLTKSGAFSNSVNQGGGQYSPSSPGIAIDFDASLSSSIYGKSDTVQPNAVKKLLYICVGNTESQSSVTDVIDVTTTENDTTPLFTGMYFDFTPNNVSWLKAGRTVDGADIYAFVYNELVNILNGETKYGELKVIDEADMIAGIDYSLYWKVNQTDMTFTTPTAISNKALSGAVVGNGMTLGLTNGNQNFGLMPAGTASGDRLASMINLYDTNIGTNGSGTTSTNSLSIGVTEDPTKSGIEAEESTAQLYFKVANAVQNLEMLNVGTVMEQAVLRTSLQEAQVVIETYVNGTSWYRVWSDGWCEQYGVANVINGGTVVNLLKSFKDTNYTIQVTSRFSAASAGATVNVWGVATTVSTITLGSGTNAANPVQWQASGYLW